MRNALKRELGSNKIKEAWQKLQIKRYGSKYLEVQTNDPDRLNQFINITFRKAMRELADMVRVKKNGAD